MSTLRNQALLTDRYDRRSYSFANFQNLVDIEKQGKKAVQDAISQGGNVFTSEWGTQGDGRGGDMSFDSSFVNQLSTSKLVTLVRK